MKNLEPIEEHFAQMHEVFGMPGVVGASFAMLTAVSDIVQEQTPGIPLLWVTGPRASGKSALCQATLIAQPKSHLGTSIQVQYLKSTLDIFDKLCHANHSFAMDELDAPMTPQLVEVLKCVHDRIGPRVAMNGVEVKEYKVCSTVMVTSIEVPTDDDALLSRCVLLQLPLRKHRENERFTALFEKGPLPDLALCPVTDWRGVLRRVWAEQFGNAKDYFLLELGGGADPHPRLLDNLAKLSAVYSFYADRDLLQLPVTTQVFNEYLTKLAVRQMETLLVDRGAPSPGEGAHGDDATATH